MSENIKSEQTISHKDRFKRNTEKLNTTEKQEVTQELSQVENEKPEEEPVREPVSAPKGRKSLMQSNDDEPEEEAEMSIWKAALVSIVAVIIAIDDEWIWIPGSIYGCFYYLYKRVRNFGEEVLSCPPEPLISATIAAGSATVISPSMAQVTKSLLGQHAKGIRTTAKAMFLSPGGIVSPFTWGLRMTFFTYFLRHAIEDTHQVEDGWYHRTSSLLAGGAVAEMGARTIVAPAAKIVDQTRKTGESPWAACRSIFKGKGSIGFWHGMAPYRVEVPHMALLLTTYSMLRGQAAKHFTHQKNETFSDVVYHIPVDLVCGGVAGAVAHTATHAWRCSTEASRGNESHFSRSSVLSTCPLVARHSSIPLMQALALRVPHTALIFGIYGTVLSSISSKFPHAGTTGWGEHDVQRATQYGGGMRNTKEEEQSFWAFFGVRISQQQTYDAHRYKSNKNDKTEN